MYDRYCKLRDKAHLKDSDIAKALKITPSTFSDWKKAKSAPNVKNLYKIAQFFHVSMEFFITGEMSDLSYKITPYEYEIILAYRKADDIDKHSVDRMLNLKNREKETVTA